MWGECRGYHDRQYRGLHMLRQKMVGETSRETACLKMRWGTEETWACLRSLLRADDWV